MHSSVRSSSRLPRAALSPPFFSHPHFRRPAANRYPARLLCSKIEIARCGRKGAARDATVPMAAAQRRDLGAVWHAGRPAPCTASPAPPHIPRRPLGRRCSTGIRPYNCQPSWGHATAANMTRDGERLRHKRAQACMWGFATARPECRRLGTTQARGSSAQRQLGQEDGQDAEPHRHQEGQDRVPVGGAMGSEGRRKRRQGLGW